MKKTVTLLLLLFTNLFLIAQTVPICGAATDRPPGCLICTPVYTGGTLGFGPTGAGLATIPCSTDGDIDNNQFLVVVADATGSISVNVVPTFCANNQGIEVTILSLRPQALLGCGASSGNAPLIPVTASASGLVPGEAYGIMIDGYNGDICNFILTVSGAAFVSPPSPPLEIRMEPEIDLCPGSRVCFSIDALPDVESYEWGIPSNMRILSGGGPNDLEVCVEVTGTGGGVVQVAGVNPCHVGIPGILATVSTMIPPTIRPPQLVCLSDLPVTIDGFVFDRIGANNAVYTTPEGCDSTVVYTLLPTNQNPNILDTTICIGDSVLVGPDFFSDMGLYNLEFSNPPFNQTNGCDSLINLFVRTLNPQAEIQPPPRIPCDPNATVMIDGSSSSTGNNAVYFVRM